MSLSDPLFIVNTDFLSQEKRKPLPPTQRLLFLMLFRELRLLTRSLKPALWISDTIIRWFEEYLQDEDENVEEIRETSREMKELYEFAKGAVGISNRVSIFVVSLSPLLESE